MELVCLDLTTDSMDTVYTKILNGLLAETPLQSTTRISLKEAIKGRNFCKNFMYFKLHSNLWNYINFLYAIGQTRHSPDFRFEKGQA